MRLCGEGAIEICYFIICIIASHLEPQGKGDYEFLINQSIKCLVLSVAAHGDSQGWSLGPGTDNIPLSVSLRKYPNL